MTRVFHITLILLLLNACDGKKCETVKGPRITQTRVISPVQAIELNMVANLFLKLDSTVEPAMEVIAQREVHSQLEIENGQDELNIDLRGCIKEHDEVILNTFLAHVRSLKNNSAGEISSASIIREDTMELTNGGLGEIDVVLSSKLVEAEIRSSGDILLSGQVARLDFSSIASGDLRAFNTIADTVNIKLGGSSVVEVYTDGVLNIEFIYPGTVSYRGTPSVINITGKGNVTDANL